MELATPIIQVCGTYFTTYLPVEFSHDSLARNSRHDLTVSSLFILVAEDLNRRGGHAGGQQGQAVKLRIKFIINDKGNWIVCLHPDFKTLKLSIFNQENITVYYLDHV